MITRPVPKTILKAMFVRVLWEHKRPGGKFSSHSWAVATILGDTLPLEFQLKNQERHVRKEWALTKDEHAAAMLGIEELQRSGFLRDDPEQGPMFKLLTEKGIEYAEKDLADITFPSVDIEQVLSRDDLLDGVRDDYLNGKYDAAIRTAFLQLEEAVRAKANQAPAVVGHDLMVAAFGQNKGVLKHPDAKTSGEEQALFFLFAGANGWFRNPTAHRTVGYNDPDEAAQILALVNLLLNMVDKCQ